MNENVRLIARHADGTETDVTEGVQALYDHLVASMDWGSNFLSIEDARGIILIAQKCGFLVPDTAAKAFEDYAQNLDQAAGLTCLTCGKPVQYAGWSSAGIPMGWHHSTAPRPAPSVYNWETAWGWGTLSWVPVPADHPVKLWQD